MYEYGQVPAGWRGFFWAAAAFNIVIGVAGMLVPGQTIDARIVGLLVLGFGLIYYFVARDPLRFAPCLWAGILGKVGVVALLSPQAFGVGGDTLTAAVLIGDGLFAIGFLIFLLTHGDQAAD